MRVSKQINEFKRKDITVTYKVKKNKVDRDIYSYLAKFKNEKCIKGNVF